MVLGNGTTIKPKTIYLTNRKLVILATTMRNSHKRKLS